MARPKTPKLPVSKTLISEVLQRVSNAKTKNEIASKQQVSKRKDVRAPHITAERKEKLEAREEQAEGKTVAWKEEAQQKPSDPPQSAEHGSNFRDGKTRTVAKTARKPVSGGRLTLREAEERVLTELRGMPPEVTDDGGTLPGAVPASSTSR